MNLLNDWESAALAAEIGVFEWPKSAADGSAGAATAETSIGLIGPGPVPIGISTIQIHPSAALTADNTNFATITVAKRTAAGAPVTLATLVTNVAGGNWAAWLPKNMAVVAGAFLSPGDVVTVTIAKSGTGVVVPQLYLAGFVAIS